MTLPSTERLKSLSNDRLAEVVRDWQVHGYSEETRNQAISILSERGVSINDLKMKGYWTNHEHDRLQRKIKQGSRLGFTVIASYLFLRFLLPPILNFVPGGYDLELSIGFVILVVFFVLLQVYWLFVKSR